MTRWIHTNWLHRNRHPDTIAFAMCVARMVNWPETLSELGFPDDGEWDPAHFIKALGDRKARGDKVWTSAYMITGGYSAGGESKEVIIARVLDRVHSRLHHYQTKINQDDTLASAWEKVQSPGIGSFLAAQVIADLKHVYPLLRAKDWNFWCAVGPGSTKGLNFLYDRPQEHTIKQDVFINEVNEIREVLRNAGWVLDAQNVQNCLCEFHKYVKIRYYGGRAKSGYRI